MQEQEGRQIKTQALFGIGYDKKIKCMKKYFWIVVVFILGQVHAQTGIGTTTPDASAKLEVSATNKGFLPPRVALTATNSASPITNPANGLMVFNTVTAGANPFQVVPGYYYWDGVGLKWVSLSTTVGNVQNQAIFRSSSNTAGYTVVSTWDARFNNIAAGDLTITSTTSFALSNGVYKIQWGLPYQSAQTYNAVQLQENISGTWGAWRGDANLAGLANGGGTDWGGTTFMTDYIDCSSATRTLRLYNPDSRTLYYGTSFIITKLNPSITTSTTADNLGNHTATTTINANGNAIQNASNIGIGTSSPATSLHIENGNVPSSWNPSATTHPSIYVFNNNTTSTNANAMITVRTNSTTGGNPFYALDVFGKYGYSMGLDNANTQFVINSSWDFNLAAANKQIIMNRTGLLRVIVPNSGGGYVNDFPSGWGGGFATYDITAGGIYYNVLTQRSDRRLKKQIKPIASHDVQRLFALNPVSYYWKNRKTESRLQYGLIAQEVEKVFPEMVSTATDSLQTKSVNYQALHALSLKALQQLNEKVNKQEQIIQALLLDVKRLKKAAKKPLRK
jgi:hypothetical protein